MYRSLYFKIILIFVLFMITVMAIVCTVLLNSVYGFYTDQFTEQIDYCFRGELRRMLEGALDGEDWVLRQKDILNAHVSSLGIDGYRNYFILDGDGKFLDGSSKEMGLSLKITPNIIAAMSEREGQNQLLGVNYADYAVYLKGGRNECIIYIMDTQEEMQQLCWQLFSIILQSVLLGFVIAVILSFFLAKAITNPIQNLTEGAQQLASGRFDYEINIHSRDEIGTLTAAFNHMGRTLGDTLKEITDERQKLDTIFTYLRDAVIAFADDGRILNINKSAQELFGVAENNFSIEKLFQVLSIEYARTYLSSMSAEKSYVLRDVEYGSRVLDINFGILRYTDRGAYRMGCITVLHDMTSRYELDKAQREFVANVSHELRTPLTGIRGAVETVQLNPEIPEDMKENLFNMAIESIDSMMNIINDLLTLSRFDNKKTHWNASVFDIRTLVTHVCEMLQTETARRGHTLRYDFRGEIPDITGDKDKIERVLINIITNAVKYTGDNGKIDIGVVYSGGEYIKIYIRDNGMGIPEGDVDKLFDRFYRVDKSRTAETGSTGLGLAIVKEIVDAHGGNISIKSKLDQGTLVTIVLPVKAELDTGE